MPNANSKFKIQNSKVSKKSVTTKVIKKTETQSSQRGISIDVYDIMGKTVGSLKLPDAVFGAPINEKLMAQAVRVYLANKRQGNASTKSRGEVQGSTRKIYKQKGTGRARHGGVRAPIFVHGGIAFGPRPHDYSLAMPKKMRKGALFSALSAKVKQAEVKVVKGLDGIEQKTKAIATMFSKLNIPEKKRKVLLVLPQDIESVRKAAQNMKGVRITVATRLNTYDVLDNSLLLLMDSSIDAIQKHFVK